jgi:two-component system sensor histidine kinase KdpD
MPPGDVFDATRLLKTNFVHWRQTQSMVLKPISIRKQIIYSIAIVILVSVASFALSGWMGYRVPAFILLLTVSLLAIVFDILPVLISAVLSALIWDVFFIPPRFALHVDNTEDAFLLIMYFIIAMINAVLTYKIRQAEQISRLKEERANSVKLYNTLLNSLSHELRTPIAAITGAVDNLQSNHHLNETKKTELIVEISKASLRLNQQVENLLNISRLESGHIQPRMDWCDIIELVYDVVKRVEENNPGRKIRISIKQDFPFCRTDKGMLEQVLYNLLNNAAIHTEPHCKIEISASCHADLLQFLIEDSGTGFTTIDSNDIFDKFSRTKSTSANGSGLGLSIVKGFTEALGGTAELNRSYRSGTQFIISIPVQVTYQNMLISE